MGKAQPLKDIGKFAESLVRDTVGSLTGIAQEDRRRRETYHSKQVQSRTAEYQIFDPAAIAAFSKMAGQLTEKTESELTAAKPKVLKTSEYMGTKLQPWNNYGGLDGGTADAAARSTRRYELQWGDKTEEERRKIQGLYNKSMTRLGAVKRARQRPGARKQSLITRKY